MKAKEFIPASKPRNFVAKNAPTSGAGRHKDSSKKKDQEQGKVKHKKDLVPMEDQGVAEGTGPQSKLDQKIIHLLTNGIPAEAIAHKLDIPVEWVHEVSKYNMPDSAIDYNDPRNTPPAGRFNEQGVAERVRDPEDWDEGNTEPPNNFAVYINGKKWKVFKGKGQFADDYKERNHYRQLQNWAQAKSAATGKEWKVYVTGEASTESIKEDTNIPFDQCPHCAGPIFHESLMNEKQDACYHKVRSRYKVWPSAYASGALVQCRKKGAKNWGNKSKK